MGSTCARPCCEYSPISTCSGRSTRRKTNTITPNWRCGSSMQPEISERAALAARLASYQSAPKPVLERLARDVIEVAGPILEHSPCPAELEAAAEARAGAHAETAA